LAHRPRHHREDEHHEPKHADEADLFELWWHTSPSEDPQDAWTAARAPQSPTHAADCYRHTFEEWTAQMKRCGVKL
jgi:hypothetical protein